ncbi:hypothetical protein ccbrp13_48950 [Ktedonobacteria bacterium brp13]|nr:hypothetical protein ccbrp13_48950 [Ktedonobacteria bacterium brp13]
MGKGRNNGRYPQDDDRARNKRNGNDRYIDNHYIYEEEYDDPFLNSEEEYEYEYDEDGYPPPGRSNPPRRASRSRGRPGSHQDPSSVPMSYPRSHYGYQGDADYRSPRRGSSRRGEVARRYPVASAPKKRSFWSGFFVGCLVLLILIVIVVAALIILGFNTLKSGGTLTNLPGLTNNHAYKKTETQQVNLAQLQQLTICDTTGNITVMVDPTATKTTVTAVKTVQSASQSDANQQLQAMTVAVQPPETINKPLSCTQSASQGQATQATPPATPGNTTPNSPSSFLTINVTFPHATNENVDLMVTLPPGAVQGSSPSLTLDVESRQGNINLSGLSGVLNVHDVNGNVAITHAIIANGSQIETEQGNINFNGYLLLPVASNAGNTGGTSPDVRYILRNETGDINVTLPANTNLTLDANTNIGTIKSDFHTNIGNSGNGSGPVNVHAPLNPTADSLPPATLVLDVSTGNVHILKANS